MSFNTGRFNRVPFNRPSVQPLPIEMDLSVGLDLDVDGIVIDDSLQVEFGFGADISAEPLLIINLEADFNAALDLTDEVVKAVLLDIGVEAGLDLTDEMVKVITVGVELDAHLDLFGDMFSSELEELFIDVVMQPGDILLVNSCNYTVTLNGVNIYDLYSGDWVFLREKSIDIVVGSNDLGSLEVKVDAIPRYL